MTHGGGVDSSSSTVTFMGAWRTCVSHNVKKDIFLLNQT